MGIGENETMSEEMNARQCEADLTYHRVSSKDEFTNIQEKRYPALLTRLDIGKCCSKWTAEYLIEKIGHLHTTIHVSPESKMDFINKNFLYKTLHLGEAVLRACSVKQKNYFIHENEYYYLRSISSERRGREVSDIHKQFPQIANDIKIPEFFNEHDFFSSVLRISSKNIQLWTHYDVMDNLLIQVQGRKRVVLFHPADVDYLYMEGDKSQVIDIDNPDLEKFPNFVKAKKYVFVLEPGDVLFIPALWLHNTLALTYGVAVNVFWKNLQHNLYDKNDFYGNKDLLPAAKALENVEKAVKLLSELPNQYETFYLKRCMKTIEKQINKMQH